MESNTSAKSSFRIRIVSLSMQKKSTENIPTGLTQFPCQRRTKMNLCGLHSINITKLRPAKTTDQLDLLDLCLSLTLQNTDNMLLTGNVCREPGELMMKIVR